MKLHKFSLRGIYYIPVEIPTWMRASRLIADHLERGDLFALNTVTRSLSLIHKSDLKDIVQRPDINTTDVPLTIDEAVAIDVATQRAKLRALVDEMRKLV